MLLKFIAKNKYLFLYGASLEILLFVLKWLELRFIIFDHALEIYIGAIAILFMLFGIWLALKLSKPKVETIIVEKEVYASAFTDFKIDAYELTKLGLSRRELEVLQLLSDGLSNQEIADRLFLSLSTVKSHCAKLFEKLNVKRTTQAVEKAKRLSLIP